MGWKSCFSVKVWNALATGVAIVSLILGLILALYLRDPIFASLRSGLTGLILATSLLCLGLSLIGLRATSAKLPARIIVVLAAMVLTVALGSELKFQAVKQQVLNADPVQLQALGQHFIVGYRDLEELKTLVEKGAIGGIFLTHRNLKGKTKTEIQQEISSLQAIRARQNLPPLWITVDQEGGIVSRLSPPLTQLPPLSEVVKAETDLVSQKGKVTRYAAIHGRELAELGVNVNFAPVVDLNYGVVSQKDRFSLIYRRAISPDPTIVSQVASWYCQTLAQYQVHCTLKHFPGLGRLAVDTHLEAARLETPLQELAQQDWLPFQIVISLSDAFVMLSHVKLAAIDPQHPVSFSQAVVHDLLRQNWQFQGILITDDLTMRAAYGSQDGIVGASIKALNAGVDLLLISYDKDLYYPAMHGLLQAAQSDKLDRTLLTTSQTRLEQQKSKLQNLKT